MKLYEDMTKEEFDVLKALDTRKFEYAGMELLGKAGVEPKDMSDSVISLAALSYFIKKYDIGSEGELHVFLDENITRTESIFLDTCHKLCSFSHLNYLPFAGHSPLC